MKLVTVLGTTGLIMAFSLNAQAAEPVKKAPKMTTAEVTAPPHGGPVKGGTTKPFKTDSKTNAFQDAMKLREQA